MEEVEVLEEEVMQCFLLGFVMNEVEKSFVVEEALYVLKAAELLVEEGGFGGGD